MPKAFLRHLVKERPSRATVVEPAVRVGGGGSDAETPRVASHQVVTRNMSESGQVSGSAWNAAIGPVDKWSSVGRAALGLIGGPGPTEGGLRALDGT